MQVRWSNSICQLLFGLYSAKIILQHYIVELIFKEFRDSPTRTLKKIQNPISRDGPDGYQFFAPISL